MENNFLEEREYGSTDDNMSNRALVKVKNKRTKSLLTLFIVLIILFSSVVGSLITMYVMPSLAFFKKTPLYSSVSKNKNIEYVGPTYFKEDENALTVTEIVRKVGPAVVGVSTQSIVDRGFFGLQQQEGIGSGFIINEEGHILTNYHVIEGARTVKVIFYDGTETDARVLNYDEANDIALLKLTDSSISVPATVTLGNSDELLVGDSVVAIGSPLGKEFLGTTTAGIISALDRDVHIEGKTLKLLQTDTAINPGNSGGPLINSRGEVIGINTAKFGKSGMTNVEGIGFSIPINQAKQKLEELSKPILRIGVQGRIIDDELSKKVNLPKGIYVVQVEPFSNAERAGLSQGDVIIKFGGKQVFTFDDLNEIKSKHNIGDKVKVVVHRNGVEKELELTLNE